MPVQQRGRLVGASSVLHALGFSALGLLFGLLSSTSAAQVSVSSGGSPNFSQPIAVPPGISGMQPNLALVYSGGGVNGPVGHGWSVQGLSMITRCPATRYTDGAPRGVKFDTLDKLCLDGQRLIQTDANGVPAPFPQSGDASGVGSGFREYRTEKDSFARVRAYGIANGNAIYGPAYFKVWTKAGQIYEYGATLTADANTKAAVAAQGKSEIMVWAVVRISDVTNNYIDFKYEVRGDVAWGSGPTAGSPTLGREWNIAEIQYTGNSAVPQLPVNKVIFQYGDRTLDKAEAYQQGSKNVSVRRLDAVNTYVNSPNSTALGAAAGATLVKRTRLTYDNSGVTKRSRLVSIKDCADIAETKCLPATTFNYSAGGNDAFVANANFAVSTLATANLKNNNGYGALEGDFNGDGRTDFIRWANNPAENQLYLSNGDGTFTQVPNGTGAGQFNLTSTNLFRQATSGAPIDNCFMSTVVDVNGDGLPDIFRWATSSGIGVTGGLICPTSQQNYVLLSKGDGSFTIAGVMEEGTGNAVSLIRIPGQCGGGPGVPASCGGGNFYLGDFNGDGYLDIVEVSVNGAAPSQGDWVCTAPALGTNCYTRIRWGRGNGRFSASVLSGAPVFSSPGRNDVVSFDADGDGLPDLVQRGFSGTTGGAALLSRGDGQFTRVGGLPSCAAPGMLQYSDVNGDGRADVICAQPTVASNLVYIASAGTAYFANGPTVAATATSLNRSGNDLVASTSMPGATFATVDLDGDGRSDVLRLADASASNVLYRSNGDGTFTASTTFTFDGAATQLTKSDGSADVVLGDFLGNGTMQMLRLWRDAPTGTTAETRNRLYVKSDPTLPDQLLSVIGPTGMKTTLTYGLLTAGKQRYTSDRGDAPNMAAYPLVDLTLASPVVITMTSDVGVGTNTLQTQYAYRGLKAALDGRGMLGFRQTVQSNKTPAGSDISVWTDYLLSEPYTGVTRGSQTRLGDWNAPTAQLLSTTTNTYCDRTSATDPNVATDAAPCATTANVRRPYLRKSIESGNDLDGTALPTVTTINTYNDYGDPTNIVVTTNGTVAGVANQTTSKVTTNTFCAPDSAGCPNKISGDNWILGRITRATVANTVPNLLASIAASPGTAANTTAIVGTGAGAAQPALALSGCTTTSPTTTPTAATMSCTLSNTGQAAASSISYSTASNTTVSGPTGACAAGATCGTVTVTTATTAATYSGTLTATPNAGTAASQAMSLVVNAATPGSARDFTLASNASPMAPPYTVAVGQPVTVVPAASGAQYSVAYWGDGTYSAIPGGWNSATPVSQMTRTYSATGTYTIEYATQIGGTWDSRTVTLTVVSQ
jgi:FG-GAP-like repeat/Salmonella virulence plasmid 65kDa B protein/Insecticide toxin TcdB middle/N-terminal region